MTSPLRLGLAAIFDPTEVLNLRKPKICGHELITSTHGRTVVRHNLSITATISMKKFICGTAVAAAVLCQGVPANADSFTWDVSFEVTAGATTVDVTGTIVTDCDSCFLQQADFISWSLAFSGGLTGTASGSITDPPGIFGNPLQAINGNLSYIVNPGSAALFTDQQTVAQVRFGWDGDGKAHIQQSDFTNVLGDVTRPFLIAREEQVSSVPGPIAGAGLPGLIVGGGCLLSRWRRKRKAEAAAV
jgi:hypothetical protein